jgi:hypothetical protein
MKSSLFTDTQKLEKYSSAVTLSDMEIFVFPELMYSLLLANIMSPIIWSWRDDPWFKNIERMNPYKRVLRLKQFIMDNYVFNLDLDTWGLTSQEKEIARFEGIIDTETLKASNALFGYHGDTYYFDVNIRKHFGLDSYDGSVIPYWKTETVEAMSAFRFKDNYSTGAGECVSLATLYAAALFIVARIPLSDIFLMATPLHSQNFVDVRDGVLTNNRRLVTKNMWINGTEISAKARRALENEQVTIVCHESGFIHVLYPSATIDPTAYEGFTQKLTAFVQTDLDQIVLGNFLRFRRDLQKCFQVRWNIRGHDYFIESEKIFAYEFNSPYLFTSDNRARFMDEIEIDEFRSQAFPNRIIFNDLEEYVTTHPVRLTSDDDLFNLRKHFESDCMNAVLAIESLISFCRVHPRLPLAHGKNFEHTGEPLLITPDMERSAIIERLTSIREKNSVADLAFYAYRDLSVTDALPFIKAALERNPVAIERVKNDPIETVAETIRSFADESIYPEATRLAQPDEVWNFSRGDGIEKALLLAAIIKDRVPQATLKLTIKDGNALLHTGTNDYSFETRKAFTDETWSLS